MVTQKAIIRNQKIRKDGQAPLCLRITKNRKHSYYTMAYLIPNQWDSVNQRVKKEHPNSTKLNMKIMALKSKVQAIALDMEASNSFFSAKMLMEVLTDKNHDNFIVYAENWIEDRFLSKTITYSSKVKYTGVIDKLKNYNKDLLINQFTVDYIKKYQKHLILKHKNSRNTINSNMSCLRAICNSLIDDGKMKLSDYPFRKIKLGYEDSQRGFLTPEDISKLRKVAIKEGTKISLSKDIFLFCLETGFRIGDALLLKKSALKNGQLYYFSQKTKDYEVMPLTNKGLGLVQKHSIRNKNSVFVFDFIDENKMGNEKSALNEQKRKTALINKNLKIIAARAGIMSTLSTHIARHSMATNALSKGLSYAEIQSLLNHSDVKTTQIYAKTHNRMKLGAIKKLN